MKLDLGNDFDLNRFDKRVEKLKKKKAKVDLTEYVGKRSLSQNAYVHVLFSLFAIELGYTLNEAKTHAKRNCHFMTYEKNGERFLKGTSDLSKDEMTQFIEWFRNYAAQEGIHMPSSEEYLQNKFIIDKEIDRNRQFL